MSDYKRPGFTYRDVQASPSGWPEEETPMLEDFELKLSNLIDTYRNKFPRQRVIEALNAQAGLLVGDAGWDKDALAPEPETEEETAPPPEELEAAPTDPTAA